MVAKKKTRARAAQKPRAAPKARARAAPKKRTTRAAPKAQIKTAPKRVKKAAPRAAEKEITKMAKAKAAATPKAATGPQAAGPGFIDPKEMLKKLIAASTGPARYSVGTEPPRARAAHQRANWKDNKNGYSRGSIGCWSCAWFNPAILESSEGFGTDDHDPPWSASAHGYCRGESVPITNLNLQIYYDNKYGYMSSGGSREGVLFEPILADSTEFWCRKWVRTCMPFNWPPLEGGS